MAAPTLQEALRTFDLRPLSSITDMNHYYVEHSAVVLERLALQLRTRRRLKILFTGHRITGKTTALNRVAHQLGDDFFVIHISIPRVLNTYDVDYSDLMFAIGLRLIKRATDENVIPRGLTTLVREDLLDDVLRWLQERIKGIPIAPLSTDMSLMARINVLVGTLEAKLSTEARTRTTVREHIALHLSELIERINYVAHEVERKSGKHVLIIVEDVDKLDLEPARRLFLEHARTLTAPRVSIIYTLPIALRYSLDFPQISANFDRHFILPIVRTVERDGSRCESGWDTLREVFLKRINENLVSTDALDTLISASGGLIGMLIRLGLLATEYALVDGKERIDEQSAEQAIAEVRGDFKALLRPDDYEILKRCLKGEKLANERPVQELLYTGALLEYHNHEPWIRVNPLVQSLVEEWEP